MTDPKAGLVLGIDLGTTNYKAMLYDAEGRQAGLGSVAPQYNTSEDGRVELPVAQCVKLIQGAIAGAVASAAASTEQIKAIAYSSQANTFLLLDADMQPLTPFIIWTDHREKAFPVAYHQLARQPEFLNTVGFSSIAPGMMVANIAWFQREQPQVWNATRHIMSLPDYFVYLLTGKAVGDSGSGALMGLWDLHHNEWWPKAVQAANIPLEYLPEFDYPGTVVGCTNPAGSRLFELPEGIPVAVGSLDHHVAAIGAGAGRIAPFSISMGTVIAATCLDDNFAVDPKCCLGPGMY